MVNPQKFSLSPLSLLISGSLFAQGAFAQQTNTNEGTEEVPEDVEIVQVTATKRVKSILDVPLSVTAIGSKQLQRYNITDVTNLDTQVPGLNMSYSGNDVRPAIRGARTEQVEANDVAVAFYSNGVYRPRHGQALAGFLDVDRVEVLRGPQGTLFGRNAFGGAINIIAKTPELGVTSFGAAATLGNYDRQRFEGMANVSVTNDLALRITGLVDTRDPFVENPTNPEAGLKDLDTDYFRVQAAYNVSDATTLNIRFDRWRDNSNGTGDFGYHALGVPVDPTTGLTSLTAPLSPRIGQGDNGFGRFGAGRNETAQPVSNDPFVINIDFQPQRDIESDDIIVELNSLTSFGELKITGASQQYKESRLMDGDLSFNPVTVNGNRIDSSTDSVEIQLSSLSTASFEWVAGLFYLNEDLDNAFLSRREFAVNPDTNLPNLEEPINLWEPWLNEIRLETRSLAAYAQADFTLNDVFTLVAGLRYTDDSREWDIFGQNPDNRDVLDFNVLEVEDASGDWNKLTWRLGINAKLTPNSLAFASVSTGFLAGNAQGAFRGDQTYDEQEVTAYEIGYKTSFLDRKMRVQLAAYYNDFEDLLSTRFDDINGTAVAVFGNAGAIEAKGIEAEVNWNVTPNWELTLLATLTDAQYGDFVTPNPLASGGETINGVDNLLQLDGEQVQQTPDYTLTLQSSYYIELGDNGTLQPSVSVYVTDDYRTNDLPWVYGTQDGYARVDASITWMSRSGDLSVQAFANNLTDEEILVRTVRFGGDIIVGDYAPPATYGVRAGYRF